MPEMRRLPAGSAPARRLAGTAAAVLGLLLAGVRGVAEEPSAGLTVRTLAEIETRVAANGRDVIKLRPAERVVPGDQILYTLEIRNVGAAPVAHPTVPYAIPDHTLYVEDSAVGPGADITFSIDGGRTYDRAENLEVRIPSGGTRAATPADYTHIRWQLRRPLQAHSVAFARFRALVK